MHNSIWRQFHAVSLPVSSLFPKTDKAGFGYRREARVTSRLPSLAPQSAYHQHWNPSNFPTTRMDVQRTPSPRRYNRPCPTWTTTICCSSSSVQHSTIIPSKLITRLSDLGINTFLWNWIPNKPQSVPQGCVLSPLLYSVFTYDCTPLHGSTFFKLADNTTVVCLINNELAYREEVQHLATGAPTITWSSTPRRPKSPF